VEVRVNQTAETGCFPCFRRSLPGGLVNSTSRNRVPISLARAPLLLPLLLAAMWGCAWSPLRPGTSVRKPPSAPVIDVAVYHRAEIERAERLEQEVARLRTDLHRAEEALVAAESGLRAGYSRADAISSLAESKIQVARAAEEAPWRTGEIEEARLKLAEADEQVENGHFGAAVFFAYRALRISDQLLREAEMVRLRPDAAFVSTERANLRAGPSTDHEVATVLTHGTPVFPERDRGDWVLVRTSSGLVGWVHRDLIEVR
jgi:hypothetical protein